MAGLIKSNLQIGDSATATQNFVITAAAGDGTLKFSRGNFGATTADIFTVDATGAVAGLALVSPTITGTISGVTKTSVGLPNVDNTSDANKPISAAQASATATLAGSGGAGLVGWIQSGVGALLRLTRDKLRETVSIKDFGAIGDGVTDDTTAIKAAILSAQTTGVRRLFVPKGTYNITQQLDLVNFNGLQLFGECRPVAQTVGTCSYFRYTPATGSLLSFDSCNGISMENMWFGYSNLGYNGDLVKTNNTGGFDTTDCDFGKCVFSGETSGHITAASLLRIEKTINVSVENCRFRWGKVAVALYSYANVISFKKNMFLGMVSKNIHQCTGTNEGLTIEGNTFEPLSSGQAAGFSSEPSQVTKGLKYSGNWHGDVSSAGGLGWLQGIFKGGSITGNLFGSAGTGASDYALKFDNCEGLSISGNAFYAKCMKFFSPSYGIVVEGNAMASGDSIAGISNISGASTICSNTNLSGFSRSKVYKGSNQSIATSTATQMSFDGQFFDQGGVHSLTVNSSRFTIPSGSAGLWTIAADVSIASASSGQWQLRILKNGSQVIAVTGGPLSSLVNTQTAISAIDVAVDSDYYEIVVYQNSGAAVNVIGNQDFAADSTAHAYKMFSGD